MYQILNYKENIRSSINTQDLRSGFTLRSITAGFSACFLGFLTSCNDPNPQGSQALISAFGNACASAGQWTQTALSHNQEIIAAIQTIQNNDACKSYSSVLTQIGSASGEIQNLLNTQSYSAYMAAQENVQELTLALNNAPVDSDLATSLSQQLVIAQANLASLDVGLAPGGTMTNQGQLANSTLQFSNYIQSVLQNTSGIQACLRQSPEVAIEMASNLLALGGSFVSPAYGAAGSVVGQLINLGVEFARNAASNDAIWDLYQAQVPTALGCGLEAMTELYCDANDAFDLIQLQATSYPDPGSLPDPIWQSIDLEERRMPVLDQWLLTVRNGTLPSDPEEAQKQNEAWALLQSLDSYYRNVYGELNRDQSLFNGAQGNTTAQFNILVSAISTVAEMLSGQPPPGTIIMPPPSGVPNPFNDLNASMDQFACWLTVGYFNGPLTQMCPADDPSHGIYGPQYISTVLVPGVKQSVVTLMSNLLSQFQTIYNPVQTQISLEFSQTITQDPAPVLAAALEPTSNNMSPKDVLSKILDFLNQDLANDDGSNPQKVPLLKDTITIVQNGLAEINDTSTTPATQKIRNLFDNFHLADGLQFFDNRIGNFVEWDLQDRLRKGEFPKNISDILKVAGGVIRDRLTESGVTNLDSVTADLNNARALTTSNIAVFRNYFEPSFAKSVKYLAEQAEKTGEPSTGANRPFGQVLGHLCTLLLASGQKWPSSVSWDICSQASLNSIYPDPKGVLDIQLSDLQKKLQGKSDQVRFCAYHRFLRAGRLAEILGGNPSPPVDSTGGLLQYLKLTI